MKKTPASLPVIVGEALPSPPAELPSSSELWAWARILFGPEEWKGLVRGHASWPACEEVAVSDPNHADLIPSHFPAGLLVTSHQRRGREQGEGKTCKFPPYNPACRLWDERWAQSMLISWDGPLGV